jgi:hypothetical protein
LIHPAAISRVKKGVTNFEQLNGQLNDVTLRGERSCPSGKAA